MNEGERRMDDRLHEVLRAAGPELSEPTVSAEARARIESMVGARGARDAAGLGGARRIGDWRGVLTWGLAAAAVVLLITTVVSVREVGRLRGALAAARGVEDAGAGATSGAMVPRLVAVNFHHDMCPVARTVTPEFHQLAARYQGEPILFVTLDLSEGEQAQALARCLGADFVFEHPERIRTGMVELVDVRRHEVLASSVGLAELPGFERALAQRIDGER